MKYLPIAIVILFLGCQESTEKKTAVPPVFEPAKETETGTNVPKPPISGNASSPNHTDSSYTTPSEEPTRTETEASGSRFDEHTSRQADVEPLYLFTGLWKSTQGEHILNIQSQWDYDLGHFNTMVHGIDLSVLGYMSSALATNDIFKMNFNPDRNLTEVLVEKTLNGKKTLIEIYFSKNNDGSLRVSISSPNIYISENFTRIDSNVKNQLAFFHENWERAKKILQKSSEATNCNPENLLWETNPYSAIKCFESHAPVFETGRILSKAIDGSHADLVKAIIQQGFGLNREINDGNFHDYPFSKAVPSGYTHISTEVGEHGYVQTNGDRFMIPALLIKGGADPFYNEKTRSQLVTFFYAGDKTTVELLLERLPHSTIDKKILTEWLTAMAFSYQNWTSLDALKVVEKLLQLGADPNRSEYGFFFPQIIANGDLSVLKLLKSSGFDACGAVYHDAREEIIANWNKIESKENQYSYKQQALNNINRIEKNLTYCSGQDQ